MGFINIIQCMYTEDLMTISQLVFVLGRATRFWDIPILQKINDGKDGWLPPVTSTFSLNTV